MTGEDDDFAQVEPIDDEQKVDENESTPRATRFATPAPSAHRGATSNLKKQQTMLNEWIDDPDNPITEKDRPMMELYAQLNEDELVYVHELQKCYDEMRCYFVQWILSRETKELVNSARISAVQMGQPFTWKHCRAEEKIRLASLPWRD